MTLKKQTILFAGSERISHSLVRRLGHDNVIIVHLNGKKNKNSCLPNRISGIVVQVEYASHSLAMTAKRLAKDNNIPVTFLCRGASKKVVINKCS